MSVTITKPSAADVIGDCLLDSRGLGEILGMSPDAVKVANFRNTLPIKPIMLGRRLRWRASDVRAWLATAGDGAGATR